MGCYIHKPGEFENRDSTIVSIESSLHICQIPLKVLELECFRFSKNNLMTPNQLRIFCGNLNIPNVSKDSLLFHFFEEKTTNLTSSLKIITLGVLLSPTTKLEKIKTLFEVYDSTSLKHLTHNDLKLMLENIFDISVKYLPKLTVISNKALGSENIKAYYSKLFTARGSILFYLFHQFADGYDYIDYERFHYVFFTVDMNILIIPSLLRNFCFIIQKNQENSMDEGVNLNELNDRNRELIRNYARNLRESGIVENYYKYNN